MYRARNHLMFPPSLKQSCEISKVDVRRIKDKSTLLSLKDDDSVDDADCNLALQRIERAKNSSGKLDGKPKSILHRNTQLETSLWSKQQHSTSSSQQQSEEAEQQSKHVWASGTEGYEYLRTPSIDPNKHGMTPMMTWGDVESTPLRVASSTNDEKEQDAGRKEFKIASQSKREHVHHLLDRKLRARKTQSRHNKSISRHRTPTRMLSPAAQQLANRVNRGSSSFTSTLRESYGTSSLKIRPHRRRSRKRSESLSSAGSSSATDGLLEL